MQFSERIRQGKRIAMELGSSASAAYSRSAKCHLDQHRGDGARIIIRSPANGLPPSHHHSPPEKECTGQVADAPAS